MKSQAPSPLWRSSAAPRFPASSLSLRFVLVLTALGLAAAGASAQATFTQTIGSASAAQAVTVVSPGGGTVSAVEVLTAGNPAGDFAAGSGASTCSGATLAAGGSCTEYVSFHPSTPGPHSGAVVLLGGSSQVIGETFLSGTGVGGLGVLDPGNMITVAGIAGVFTGTGDGGVATAASLDLPSGVAFDGAGNLYIADSLHNRVRMVCGAKTTAVLPGTTCGTAGIISTVAGDDTPGYSGDGGPAASATLDMPTSMAVDGAGNLYIADTGNNVIRKISAATGDISTVAGGAAAVCAAATDTVGDGCPAIQATLNAPSGVALDAAGNLYIADTYNQRIREVSAATGVITMAAGTGATQADGSGGYNGDNIPASTAELNLPFALAFDPQGDLYIADSGNQRIREVLAVGGAITAASNIVTLAGTGTQGGPLGCAGPGPASKTELSWPEGVAVDAAGNVYIADTQNDAIRKVNATTHALSTLVQQGCGQDFLNGGFIPVQLYGPIGLTVDGSGNVFIADGFDMVVTEVQSNFAAIDDENQEFPTQQGTTSSPTLQEVENDGNAALDLTSLTAGTNTAIDSQVTNACAAGTLAADADCNIGAEFSPALTPVIDFPQTESGAITADENTQPSIPAANNPLDTEVVGTAGPGYGTETAISSSPNPSAYQQAVSFTVSVTTGIGTPTGTVSVMDTYNGATSDIDDVTLTDTGGATASATFTLTTLGVGKHSLVASYYGDKVHLPSKSTDDGKQPYIQTVQANSATTLSSSLNPSLLGEPVTFTAVVASAPAGYLPSGTVTFMDGNTTLGTDTLTTVAGAQQATILVSSLPNGPNSITAVYQGDTADGIEGSTSTALSQDVLAPSTFVLSSDLNPVYFQHNVTFTATVSSQASKAATGSVTFFDNGVQIGTGILSGNPAVAKFSTSSLALGSHPITASYAGDAYNSEAQSGTLNEVVTQEAFTLSVTPAALTLKAGTNGTLPVQITSVGGYSDTISFGCASLPAMVTCNFSPIVVKLPAGGTVTTSLVIDTNNPLEGGVTAASRSAGGSGGMAAGFLLPFGAVFAGCFRRRRGAGMLTLLLALAVSAAMLLPTGCGGISLSSAAPGTYKIQVSGTAQTGYFTRSQNVTVTITQ